MLRQNYINELSSGSSLVVGNSTPNNSVLEYIQPDMTIRSRTASYQLSTSPLKRGSVGNIGAISGSRHVSRKILFNIIRAFLVRALFIVHSLTTIWAAVNVRNDSSLWTFALVSALIAIEGAYTIVLRAGDERKWFVLV